MLTDKTVGELQDEVKACKRRIEELRSELDEERELTKELPVKMRLFIIAVRLILLPVRSES